MAPASVPVSRLAVPARHARGCERVAAVAGLRECVRAEAQAHALLHDLVDDGAVLPLVQVVDQLGALVAEEPGVLETGGA